MRRTQNENLFVSMTRDNKRPRVNGETSLPNKRRRVTIEYEGMNPGANQTSKDSSDDDACLNKVLEKCALVKKMEIPSAIIDEITKFGRGDIAECRKCKKEDHVDDIMDLPKRQDPNWGWIHDKYADTSLCSVCYDELICSFCNLYSSEDNDNLECAECDIHVDATAVLSW